MSIPLLDLQAQHRALKKEILAAVGQALDRSDLILGGEVDEFEREFAAYCGAKHCVGVGNGLDALELILRGLGVGPGDEVITAANTFAATVLAIIHAGATPVLVDHDPDTYAVDPDLVAEAITPRTRAIMAVHLYGHPARFDALQAIADEHGVLLLEDAAQAHGAEFQGRRCGSLGRAAAFSFYPGKNLGALGDAGAVVTDDDDLACWLRGARNYGSTVKYRHTIRGFNSRLDTVQAAVLRIKLRYLDRWNEERRAIAARYQLALEDTLAVTPTEHGDVRHVYHQYVIRCPERDRVLARLQARGIGAMVHYPIPIHRQVAFGRTCRIPQPLPCSDRLADHLLSLPIGPYMSDTAVDEVARAVREALPSPGPSRSSPDRRLQSAQSSA